MARTVPVQFKTPNEELIYNFHKRKQELISLSRDDGKKVDVVGMNPARGSYGNPETESYTKLGDNINKMSTDGQTIKIG